MEQRKAAVVESIVSPKGVRSRVLAARCSEKYLLGLKDRFCWWIEAGF